MGSVEPREARRLWRRRGFVIGALPALAAVATAVRAADASEQGTVVDIAGRQRMLTQRIVKAYCQVGLNLTAQVSRAQLAHAVRLFDSQRAKLERTLTDAAARSAVARSGTLWKSFRQLATGPVSREGARRLAALGEQLLAAAQEVVSLLQAGEGSALIRLIDLAGRQRMLSQRLAKLYMLRAYGVDSPDFRAQMDGASQEFSRALVTLRGASENSADITRELDAVAMQWEWFTRAIELQGAQSYTLVVADASESILNSMDLVTGLYVAMTRR